MPRNAPRDSIAIGAPRLEEDGGTWRVTADVDGEPVWFESPDLELAPVAEAWATAFTIPALERGARLALETPLDEVWLDNIVAIQDLLHEWWGYPLRLPLAAAQVAEPANGDGGETALFFSAGADSFYTLLRGGHRVDRLVLIQGFDFGLDAASRQAVVERSLRAVARARGIAATVVRTNARMHPLVRAVSWERAHGGVLAGVGHVLGGAVRRVLISSSISLRSGRPWGSHFRLDPMWGSGRRAFLSVGQERRKGEKLRAIAQDPLVHEHLHVCWQNPAHQGNCSKCNKCVYARLVLADCGVLERCRTLEGAATLAADIDALPRAKQRPGGYAELLHGHRTDEPPEAPPHGSHLTPEVKRAIRDLLARTARLESRPVRWRRALLSRVLSWVRPGRA
jgi:hypothetical protein